MIWVKAIIIFLVIEAIVMKWWIDDAIEMDQNGNFIPKNNKKKKK